MAISCSLEPQPRSTSPPRQAYQRELHANCPYPSSSYYTGIIGTINNYFMHDVFVTRLDAAGTRILSSTLLGGDCYEYPTWLAVDNDGNAWVSGVTNSNPFPQVSPFLSGPENQRYQGFVAKVGSDAQLLLSSFSQASTSPAIAARLDSTAWIGDSTAPGSTGQSGGIIAPLIPPLTDAYLARVGTARSSSLRVTGVGSVFTNRSTVISPGELVRITVDGFDPGETIHLGWVPSGPLPRTLAGAEVQFDGEPAALYPAGPGYFEGVVPYTVQGKASAVVQVEVNGVASTALRAIVRPVNVVLYSVDGTGTGQAAARNEDGSLNAPDNPAAPGSAVTFFFTGAGVTDASCPDGGVATWDSAAPVGLNNSTGPAEYRALPGFLCGLYQARVRVPDSAPTNLGWQFWINGPNPRPVVTFAVKRPE